MMFVTLWYSSQLKLFYKPSQLNSKTFRSSQLNPSVLTPSHQYHNREPKENLMYSWTNTMFTNSQRNNNKLFNTLSLLRMHNNWNKDNVDESIMYLQALNKVIELIKQDIFMMDEQQTYNFVLIN